MSTSVENVCLFFFLFLYTSDWIEERPCRVWSIRGRSGRRRRRRRGPWPVRPPRRPPTLRYTLYVFIQQVFWDPPRVDISTATDNIQMYKYKNKIWAIWMQTQLSDTRSALLFFSSLCFSYLHFTLRRRVSDWAWRTHPFLQFALAVLQESSSSARHKHTPLVQTHTHPHAHPRHTISCRNWEKISFEKKKKKKKQKRRKNK